MYPSVIQLRQTNVPLVSLFKMGYTALALRSGTPIPFRKFLSPLKVKAYFYCIVKINNKSLGKMLVAAQTRQMFLGRALKLKELLLGEHKN